MDPIKSLVDWVESVGKPLKRPFDYVRNFDENVKRLRTERENAERAQVRLQHEVEDAERKLQRIEPDVRDTQSKAKEILEHVKSMEERIADCPDRWWTRKYWCRYQLGKELEEKTVPEISELLKEIARFVQPGRVGYCDADAIPTIEFLLSKDFVVSKSSKAASDQIIAALKDENVSMVGLWGMGGVGKTTLVHQVGNLVKDLFDKVVFATVSKTPNFETIQDEIAKYLNFVMKDGQGRRLKQEFWSRLQKEKRILIILDDVWAKIDLKEDIGIPFGENHPGCKILLTTRRLPLCRSMDCQKKILLGCLDKNEAWALFQRKAGLENSNYAIKEVAIEVVKKCQGLPISLITLGAALKGKSLVEWETAHHRLENRRLHEIEDIVERNAYLCLEESFNYLKDVNTKMCFLLCSLFPEDYEIYVEDLVRYFAWGLHLYKDIDSIEKVRTEVRAAMVTLKNSCLLLDCGSERRVKMHDTVRDVALWIVSQREDIASVIKYAVVERWPKKECFDSCTAISFKTAGAIGELLNGLVCPKLRILLLESGDRSWIPKYMSTTKAFFEGMKSLQVCSLHRASISRDAFQFQTNLRTLRLFRCRLPDISQLGKLKELQVLYINQSDIKELPDEIGDLNNLRLLDLTKCAYLTRIPPGLLRRLSQLEELYLHDCGPLRWGTEYRGGNASLSELNSLSKLIILSLDVRTDDIPKDFLFPKLQRFIIQVSRGPYPIFQDALLEYSVVRECYPIFQEALLEFSVVRECYPILRNILKSELDYSLFHFQKLIGGVETLHLKEFDVKCLIDTSKVSQQRLHNLVELTVSDMHALEVFCNGPQPQEFLQNLEQLGVASCPKLQALFQSDEPSLRSQIQGLRLKIVRIRDCDKLRYLFSASIAKSLRQLESLCIMYCGELEEIIQKTEASNSIQHGFSHHVNLHRLKFVIISGCDKLRYLFPTSVAKSLGQLKELAIIRCLQLEEIIQKTEASNICLQSLRKVTVIKCNKLTSLSSLTHGQFLENLTELEISDCSALEYTFPSSMDKGLQKLNKVTLKDLPQLKGSNNGNDIVLTLPSLQNLDVISCPQLSTSNVNSS